MIILDLGFLSHFRRSLPSFLSTFATTKMFAKVESAFFPRIVAPSDIKRCFSVLKVSQSKLVTS